MITYSEQTLDSVEIERVNKPPLYAGKTEMPLDQLDDRRFELLTYFTIKQCIQSEGNWNGFEHIELMGGVKDRGMDCIFKKEGTPIGVIQCKHSTKGIILGKTMMAKEILKFLLYSIAIPSLIPDINYFTYFMFSSAGLKPEVKELLDHFNEQIPGHLQLKKWVNEVIAQHASLTVLQNFDSVRASLIPLLEKIKVRVILRNDFDLLLSRDFNANLLSTFFTVRSVLDEKKFSDLLDEKLHPTLSFEKAMELVVSASSDLSQIPGFFGNLSTTHIDRPETLQIHDWVLSDLATDKKPLALLEANAGMGKTIVFRDLYQKLTSKGIPVLAIKADRYYAEDRIALEKKMFQQRNVNLLDVLFTLLQEHQKVVVLIDQMDALSLTLSTKRDYLTTYNRLISDLLGLSGIRIILSIRSFDLNYDADLRGYKSNSFHHFPLGHLPKPQVKKVLSAYGMTTPDDPLLDLLAIPNHLNTYCKISASSLRHNDQLKSLNDLHKALWEDLMKAAKLQGLQLKELLFAISCAMSQREQITIPNLFTDQYSRELDYLYSRDILSEVPRGIQFFHQTFYDYTFAKQFVESGDSLMSYLKAKRQSLYVRPVVKMVIEYLRDYKPVVYNDALAKIVSGTKYRFHIKLLLLNSLCLQSDPTPEEKNFVTKHVLPYPTYADAFLTSVQSTGWMEFLMEQQVLWDNMNPKPKLRQRLQKVLPQWIRKFRVVRTSLGLSFEKEKELRTNLVFRILLNNRLESLDRVIDFLERLKGIEGFIWLAQHVFIHIDDWENERLLPLFDHYMPYREDSDTHQDNFWFYHILEKIAAHHLLYCIKKLSPILLKLFARKDCNLELSHEQDKLLKHLNELYPEETFLFLFGLMKNIVEAYPNDTSDKELDTPLYESFYFSDIHLASSVSSNADEIMFDIMQDYLRGQATVNPSMVRTFYENNKESNAIPVLKLCAVALEANPSKFHGLAYDFITIIYSKSGLSDWDDQFQYLVRKLIGASFTYFDKTQKESIAKILFSIKNPTELSVFIDSQEKKHILNRIGEKQYLFLNAIPEAELRKHLDLWKRFQELQRKFQKVEDRPKDRRRYIAHAVGGPLSTNAYNKMDLEHWKQSMLKYGDDYVRDRFTQPSKGGKSQHSQAFKKQVEQNPEYFYPLVAELLATNIYAQDYSLYGLWGLIEGKFDEKKVFLLYKLWINKKIDKEHFQLTIYFCQYFIRHEVMDITVLEFLANLVNSLPNPEKIYKPTDLLHESLNNMRSAALIRIMSCTYNSSFGDLVLQTVEQVVQDKHPLIQAAILGHVANLNHFDQDRAFALFKEASSTDDLNVLSCSFWSANYYLPNYFDELKPYFLKILEHEELHEDGVVLIAKAWIFNNGSKGDAQKLLERAFASGEKAVCAILNTTEHLLIKDRVLNPRSMELLFRCLKEEGEKLSSRFTGLILRKFTLDIFPEVYPFLRSYLKSAHAQREPRYLLNYITDCAKMYPIECLYLVEMALEFGHGDIQKKGYVDKEPVQAVLAIYSALNLNPNVPDKAFQRTLDLFDRLLLNSRYRNHASNAIGQI